MKNEFNHNWQNNYFENKNLLDFKTNAWITKENIFEKLLNSEYLYKTYEREYARFCHRYSNHNFFGKFLFDLDF